MNVSHVSSRHLFQQGPMLATLGKTAARALAQRVLPRKHTTLITPGPEIKRSFDPLPSELLDAYVAHVGGDPRAYREIVPPHFFPHWAMPVAADALQNLPYPILRVLNAGCRMQVNASLPRKEALHVRAHLANVEDDGRRALLTQRVVTETESAPNALVVELYAYVPLHNGRASHSDQTDRREAPVADRSRREAPVADRSRREASAADRLRREAPVADRGRREASAADRLQEQSKSAREAPKTNGAAKPTALGDKADKRDKPRVPRGVHEIDFLKLGADAGLSFAKLTGDFNPIHWLPAYAKTAGFRNVILHGFGTFARCCESLNRGLFGGDVRKLQLLEAKFTRPLVLPHAVGVYVHEREVFVGDGIEGPAYMTGRFVTGEDR